MFRFISHQSPQRKAVMAGAATLMATAGYLFLKPKQHPDHVVIVGGGTGGVGVAAMLQNEGIKNITIVEPKDVHYYQPLWTLCGAGIKDVKESARPMKDIIPKGTKWVKEQVSSFEPSENQITTADGQKINYDYLVVAAGIQTDWDAIPGLKDGLEKKDSGVVSIYDYKWADKTSRELNKVITSNEFSKENPAKLLFTFSPTVLKCAGAPQKIMWLFEDILRSDGKRDAADISFWTPGGAMFGVKHYSDKLEKIRKERGVNASFGQKLIEIDPVEKIATFEDTKTKKKMHEPFDVLHVAPHMSAPAFIKNSPLSDDSGFVDVDKFTLQSKKFDNVFALGDCTNTPNSKTAAAITSQAPVLVHNLHQKMQNQKVDGVYTGYASCPLIIAKGHTMLAEFGYGGRLMETFSPDTGKFPFKYFGTDGDLQMRFFYLLKERLFPFVYWNLWTKGAWYGTNGPIKPAIVKKEDKDSGHILGTSSRK